tara:strand:- start:286 stop:1215 length:930 start_codon:yes stop_codon:yes gene_type:complete
LNLTHYPENNLRAKIKVQLLSNPKFNPYKFSLKKFYRNLTSTIRVLPDFIIIGSGRAGTTALYSYLIQHPSIIPTSTENNNSVADLHFFEYMISDKISWYKSHFPTIFSKMYRRRKSKNSFVTGEFTSTYMYHENVPERIFNLIPKIKLIVILRNPIDKAYSTYNQQLHVNEFTSSFEETIKAEFRRINLIKNHAEHQNHNPDFGNYVVPNIIRHGIYFNYLEKWFQIFSKEQIFVVDSNELENFTQQTLNKVFEFLDLPHHEIPNLSKINVGKYSPMSESTRKSLVEFYGPYNAKLNSLLKTNYDWNK